MKKRIALPEAFVYTLLLTCMVFICIRSTVQFFYEGNISCWAAFVPALLSIVYCFAVYYTKLALLALPLAFLLPKPLYIIRMFKRMALELPYLMQDVQETGYVTSKYSGCFIWLIVIGTIIISVSAYFIAVKLKRSIIILISGAAMYTAYSYFVNEGMNFSCGLFVGCSIMLYGFNRYMSKKKHAHIDKERYIKPGDYVIRWLPSIASMMAVIIILSSVLPTSIDFKPMNKLVNLVDKMTAGMEGPGIRPGGNGTGYFAISSTGFQKSRKRLGGPVKLSDVVAFVVSSNDKINGLHMRGNVKTDYTGDYWNFTAPEEERFSGEKLGYVPVLNAASVKKDITLTYKIMGIKTIFSALYPDSIKIDNEKIYGDKNMQLANTKNMEKGERYTISIKEYSWEKDTLINAPKLDGINDELTECLSLPDNIPQRVYDLADEITAAYDKPYLKASAIENYLKINYPYSLDTSELPKGKEFVDYFLFNEKKGSCTYYATAMAIMCRMEGIPSRYVEGFTVPSGDASEGIDIKNSDAHAWTELYFNGLGWIMFDPTPGHGSNAISFNTEDEEEDERIPDRNHDEEIGVVTPSVPYEENKAPENTQTEENPEKQQTIPGAVWAVLVAAIAAALIVYAGGLYFNKGVRRLYYEFYKISRYGREYSCWYTKGQSVREYLIKLENTSKINMESFLEGYERYQYSGKENIDEKAIREVISSLYKGVINKRGRAKALWIRVSNPFAYIFRGKRE